MGLPLGYLGATRHPFPCLLFVVPLLVLYEVGVLALGGPNPETIRNGADHWMRCAFTGVGLQVPWLPPVLLAGGMVLWAITRREDRPGDLGGVLCGMILESVAFALGLWGLSRILAPLLLQAGFELSVSGSEPAMRQVVTYLGAGIYEEAIFRLVLFSVLVGLLKWLDLPAVFAVLVAALGSAILFSTAHHVGPYGQAYSNYLFLFRLAAGLYFAFLFQFRGFGIAVGAHACYNVMVTIS